MPHFSAKQVVKLTAATALVTLTFCPPGRAGGPAMYATPPASAANMPGLHAEQAPYAGTSNYGIQTRAFRYGWFGAEHYYPSHQSHKTYYEDVIRWSRWRCY